VLLLVSVLSNLAPLSSASGNHICALACCAGKPPHEAGSCMTNACGTELPLQKEVVPDDDPICDPRNASAHAGMQMGETAKDQHASRQQAIVTEFDFTASDQLKGGPGSAPSIEAATFSKPCPPDCGGAATSSSGGRNKRYDSRALSFTELPRPPSVNTLLHFLSSQYSKLELICRQSPPRGPPFTF
jgi:hypothetical protein